MTDHRRHPMRVLTRLEGRVPALHALLTRSHARRFDALAPSWDAIRADVADSQRMLERALDELGLTAPARVLDVGTGTGQAAGILLGRYPGAQIDAVDASAQMIERARAKPELSGVRFAVGDGGRLPFADASFDLAVSLLVQPFERELLRVLVPGGWALFCYPWVRGRRSGSRRRSSARGSSARASRRCAPAPSAAASGRPGGADAGAGAWASRAREAPARRCVSLVGDGRTADRELPAHLMVTSRRAACAGCVRARKG